MLFKADEETWVLTEAFCQRDDLICHLKWKLRNCTLHSKIIILKNPASSWWFGLYRTDTGHLSIQAGVPPLELSCHSLLFLDPEAKPESPAESTGNLSQHSAGERVQGRPDPVMKQHRPLSVGALTQRQGVFFEWMREGPQASHMRVPGFPQNPKLSPQVITADVCVRFYRLQSPLTGGRDCSVPMIQIRKLRRRKNREIRIQILLMPPSDFCEASPDCLDQWDAGECTMRSLSCV